MVAYLHLDQTRISGPRFDAAINGRCRDVSKSRVDDIFSDVFGYSARVDPRTYHGPIVEKSEDNAAHDGRLLQGPLTSPRSGKVYLRLVDNICGRDSVMDLRPCVVGAEIPFVYKKFRSLGRRFAGDNFKISWCGPDDVFSVDEQAAIIEFSRRAGLDVGELDVLRDAQSGKIYIVDIAKTPHSPGDNLLSLGGIICMHRAARAFDRAYLQRASVSAMSV